MERLTKRSADGTAVWFVDHEKDGLNLEPCEMEYRHSGMAIRKLAEYEDLEEQGKLLKLPCAVGDTVYAIYSVTSSIHNIYDFEIDARRLAVNAVNGNFGKTVFVTREEAETALENMN